MMLSLTGAFPVFGQANEAPNLEVQQQGADCKNSENGYPDVFCGERVFREDGNATVFIKVTSIETGRLEFACSGVIVGRRSILTAAHCFTACGPPCETVIGYGDSIRTPLALVPVESVSFFPAVRGAPLSPGNDFALLTTAEHALLPAQQQVARILMARSFLTLRPPMLVATGYGISSPTDRTKFGEAFEVSIPVASHGCADAAAAATGCSPFREFILADRRSGPEASADTCGGDSGGPVMIPDRVPRIVVGITSRQLDGKARQCGSGGIYGLAGTVPVLEWLADLVPDLRVVTRW